VSEDIRRIQPEPTDAEYEYRSLTTTCSSVSRPPPSPSRPRPTFTPGSTRSPVRRDDGPQVIIPPGTVTPSKDE
jgi:hypothetical protein